MQIELFIKKTQESGKTIKLDTKIIEVNGAKKVTPQILQWIWQNTSYGWKYDFAFKK